MDNNIGPSNNRSNETGDYEELLNFDTAMRDFCEMFPNLQSAQIENVLKKYDGDVSATINELLFDLTINSPTSSAPSNPQCLRRATEDRLSVLLDEKQEIQKKLDSNQKLLDKVVDVETAREYEDQQLACLLQYRELDKQIKEEKEKRSKSGAVPEKVYRKKSKPENFSTPSTKGKSSSTTEIRIKCPEGPYVGKMDTSATDMKYKISAFKKASASRLTRLFSNP